MALVTSATCVSSWAMTADQRLSAQDQRRPLKATAGWKPLLQRLQLLGRLLPSLGMARGAGQPGFSLEGLVHFLTVALGNSNAEACTFGAPPGHHLHGQCT